MLIAALLIASFREIRRFLVNALNHSRQVWAAKGDFGASHVVLPLSTSSAFLKRQRAFRQRFRGAQA
ncbi:hypothetical protein NFH98_05490 [Halomonas sp. H33-56]|uniref:hypothetical protein n=1 Tax=unclassified Halomonas TaxID=2609666 RepID=UPI000F5DE3E2|nr:MULTISPECIES: hypothetical protein [unclassified Halomonas]MBY5941698.1 hypothetical protein [Halomonas sp. DP5N14-9]RQW72654.1 hypothetical protein EBB56_01415 [Halomonas sp. YLB-10]